MDSVNVVTVDPADEALLADLFRLHEAVHAADRPDEPRPLWKPFQARLREANPEIRQEMLAARQAGQLVGSVLMVLPVVDNRHLAHFYAEVSPVRRRRGVGRALVARVAERARADQRRTLIAAAARPVPGGPPRSDAGGRFLTALGFHPAIDAMQRRIDLAAVDPAAERQLLAECLPHAAGYQTASWVGHTPDPLVDGVAYLVNRLNSDAPTGELDLADSTLDGARLHAGEQLTLDRGTHLIGAAARGDSGEVAAFTRVDLRPPGDHGTIWVTIADPRHRGHRLGTIVKIEAHRLVRTTFPDLQHVYTGNADSNAHMVAINERLGYVAYEATSMYQLRLDQAHR